MSAFALLRKTRFAPLFATQFLGAFNGVFFKSAVIVLALYHPGGGGKLAATAATGLFTLPFLLLSAGAGHLADRLDKARLIRATKLFEIACSLLAIPAIIAGQGWALLAVVFLFGVQAALFGPLKYGILPEHLEEGELLAGNALIESATFLAILFGTIAGSLAAATSGGRMLAALLVPSAALAGWRASRLIPGTAERDAGAISFNPLAETARLLAHGLTSPGLAAPILALSWFWLAGATYLTQLPALVGETLLADPAVVALFLTMFSVGIGIGSLLSQRLLKGAVGLKLAAPGALGMALFGMDLARRAMPAPARQSLLPFLAEAAHWRLLADLLLIAVSAGLYVVPIQTLLQVRAAPAMRARTIAAANIVNALFMTAGALLAGLILAAGQSVPGLLFGLAALDLPLAVLMLFWALRFRAEPPASP